jgi:hypothetical protein
MRNFLAFLLWLPLSAHAAFILQYGLNYSSQNDNSSDGEFKDSRTFHKAFLGASVNGKKTFFFGWNINSWSSSLSQGSNSEDTYSLLEMGPRIQWFTNENNNLYFTADWNPYASGKREKAGSSKDITASSIGLGVGYRFRLSKIIGLGAAIHYHSLTLKEEKDGNTSTNISDKISNFMPMLEFTIITR